MKWHPYLLEAWKRFLIVSRGHLSNFKVTHAEKSIWISLEGYKAGHIFCSNFERFPTLLGSEKHHVSMICGLNILFLPQQIYIYWLLVSL